MTNTKPQAPDRPEQSVKLTEQEKKALTAFCEQYSTDVKRARMLGIERTTLIRIRQFGSGSQASIEKLRAKLLAS